MQGRHEILDWAEEGRIAPQDLRRALDVAGALPDSGAWRQFLDRLLLFAGTTLVAAGVVFFLAFNWNDLGRFAKFALVQVLLVGALAAVWRFGVERIAGKAALLGAALFTGALFALIGQTYQTGADTFELFAVWAIAVLPWALVARFPALWLFWLLLANVAATLYVGLMRTPLWLFAGTERQLWLLFALNTAALAVWEGLALSGVEWLRERWSVRILATASGGFATALAVTGLVGKSAGAGAAAAWIAWMVAAYVLYRHRTKDLFVLAGGVLSVVVVISTFVIQHFFRLDASSFLFVGLLIIGISAAGGWWLKTVAAEEAR